MKKTKTVCEEATMLTTGARRKHYGNPNDNFEAIATMVNQYLLTRGIIDDVANGLDSHDIPMFMILTKVCREAHNRQRDNIVDIAGYSNTIGMLD